MRRPSEWIPVAIVAVVASLLLPGGAARVARAQGTSFQATVMEDNVEARAGASKGFYVVGTLKKGATVTVDEVIEGWNKIVPPPGVQSLIPRAFVDAKGDGKTGVVNSDNREVRAAHVNPSEVSYRRQVALQKNDTVQIVGERGDDYVIAPPQGAYVYLPPGSVRRLEAAPAPAPAPAPIGEETPAPAPAPTPVRETPAPAPTPMVETPEPTPPLPARTTEVTPAPTREPEPVPRVETPRVTEVVPEPTPVRRTETTETRTPGTTTTTTTRTTSTRQATPDSAALRDAERRLEEAQKLPLAQQPLEQLMSTYQGLQNDPSLSLMDRRIVAVRMGQLRRNTELAAGLRALKDAAAVGSTPIEPPPEPKVLSPGTYDPSRYDAIGQLLASTVYNGETGPRLFRLVEPSSGRTIAYLIASSRFDPAQSLGRIVGIMGETRYDPALKLNVIDVKSVDVLLSAGDRDRERDRAAEPRSERTPPPRSERVAPTGEMTEVRTETAAPPPPTPTPTGEMTEVRTEVRTSTTTVEEVAATQPATQPAEPDTVMEPTK